MLQLPDLVLFDHPDDRLDSGYPAPIQPRHMRSVYPTGLGQVIRSYHLHPPWSTPGHLELRSVDIDEEEPLVVEILEESSGGDVASSHVVTSDDGLHQRARDVLPLVVSQRKRLENLQ